jgi:hypothetical protein
MYLSQRSKQRLQRGWLTGWVTLTKQHNVRCRRLEGALREGLGVTQVSRFREIQAENIWKQVISYISAKSSVITDTYSFWQKPVVL